MQKDEKDLIVAHKCRKCGDIILDETKAQRRFSYYVEGNLQVRTTYYFVCEKCAQSGV